LDDLERETKKRERSDGGPPVDVGFSDLRRRCGHLSSSPRNVNVTSRMVSVNVRNALD
jgi:hypothetical protein